jgi:hypothetical protein
MAALPGHARLIAFCSHPALLRYDVAGMPQGNPTIHSRCILLTEIIMNLIVINYKWLHTASPPDGKSLMKQGSLIPVTFNLRSIC